MKYHDPSSIGGSDMFLNTASQCSSMSFLDMKRSALAILFLPAVAIASSGSVATGDYANDLGYIMGAIDSIKHRATVCTEGSPPLSETHAGAMIIWNKRNLFVIGEVNERYKALSASWPKIKSEATEQERRKKLDQLRVRFLAMSPEDAKEICQRVAENLNTDLFDIENVAKSQLESVRGYSLSGEKWNRTPD